ncbi:MAG: M15 family metallopeptidase [Bacilli bacterium]|nr:M15 family metallopeptidase [Bacilli bacterium]
MKKKRLKLKKKVWYILVAIIFIPIFIISFFKVKNNYEYKKTYEYRFINAGYSKEEYQVLAKYFDDDYLETLLKNDKDEDLIKLVSNKHFILENLDRYQKLYNHYHNIDIDEIVLNINLNLDYDYYEVIEDTDISKNNLMLVNKYNKLPDDYEPEDLVTIGVKYCWGEGKKIRKEVYESFMKMWEAAYDDGIYLVINLAYRSYADQEAIYNRLMNQKNRKYADSIAARPGHSEHQTGLAIDIFDRNNTDFENSDANSWLQENAYKYGFIQRYTEDNVAITGFNTENYHYRYVGKEDAKKIFDQKITFDEYYHYNVK